MNVPPSLLKVGLSALGVGGTGIATWQLVAHTSSYPSPIHSDLDVGDLEKDSTFSSYDCFDRFFSNQLLFAITETSSDNTPSESDFQVENPTSQGDSSKTIGCSLMRLVYGKNLKDDIQELGVPDMPVFTFKAEITFKNDKVGWALWVIGEGRELKRDEKYQFPNYKQELKYRLLLLESVNSNWEIKGGYEWYDAAGFSENFTMNVDSPNEKWIEYHSEDLTKPSNIQRDKRYSGIWEIYHGGNEIFQDIHVSAYNRSHAEMLGKEGSEFKAFDSVHRGQEGAGYSHLLTKYKDKQWITYASKQTSSVKENNGVDVSSVLNEWYKPFKNANGGWKDAGEYCWDVGANRDKAAFKAICESPKSQ